MTIKMRVRVEVVLNFPTITPKVNVAGLPFVISATTATRCGPSSIPLGSLTTAVTVPSDFTFAVPSLMGVEKNQMVTSELALKPPRLIFMMSPATRRRFPSLSSGAVTPFSFVRESVAESEPD